MPDVFVSPTVPRPMVSGRPSSAIDRLFGTYLFLPKHVRFENQQSGETVILLLRRHWATNLGWVIMSAIFLLCPVFLFPLLIASGLIPESVPVALTTILSLGWYLCVVSYIFTEFLQWYFTVSIVTNERIVDIDLVNILNKKYAETRISKVEDVTAKTGGAVRAVLDYGDVIVQTAGSVPMFQFLAVPHPREVVRIMNNLLEVQEEIRER